MGRIKLERGNKRKKRKERKEKNRKYVESDEYKNGKYNFVYYERKKMAQKRIENLGKILKRPEKCK